MDAVIAEKEEGAQFIDMWGRLRQILEVLPYGAARCGPDDREISRAELADAGIKVRYFPDPDDE